MLEVFTIDQGLDCPLNEKFQNFMTFISPTMFAILLLLTSFFFLFLEPNKVISAFFVVEPKGVVICNFVVVVVGGVGGVFLLCNN